MSEVAPASPAEAGASGSSRVAAGILLSRVAGTVREITLAAFLGNGAALEAFAVAVRVPNILQNLLGEGVLSASFIPSYAKLLAQGRQRDAARLAAAILGLLMAMTGALVVVGVLAAPQLTSVIAPGLSGDRQALTITLVRIVTPGIGLLVASAWCLGVLNSHRQFFLSYVAPVAWNLVQIVALAVAGTLVFNAATADEGSSIIGNDARGLALVLGWSTVVGAAAQVAVQLPAIRKLLPGLRPTIRIDAAVKEVLSRFAPVVGARGVVQLSAFLDTLLASFLAAGAIGALRYGQVLYLLPISLFGMSVAAAELPEMSAATGRDEAERAAAEIRGRLRSGLSRISYFVIPTAFAYLFAGDLVVGALLQRGEFTRADTLQVWAVLGGYGVGLLGATSARLLQSASYGLGDAKTPARASVIRVALSSMLGVVLMFQLDRVGIGPGGLDVVGQLPAFGPLPAAAREAVSAPRLGALGLTLGSGIAAWAEYWVLRDRLRHRIGLVPHTGGVLFHTTVGAVAAVVVTALARLVTGSLPVFLQAVVALPLAGLAYLLVTKQLGFPWPERCLGGDPTNRPVPDGPPVAAADRT